MTNSKTQTKIMMDRAKSASLARDFPLATRLYRSLLQNDPENLELLQCLGNLYERSGNDKDSIPIYKEMVRIDEKNVDAMNALGGIYRRLRRYDESIEILQQAVIVDENNGQIFYNLGYTYKLMGKYDAAIQCFNRVVDQNPSDVLAYNHLGTIYALENKHDEAVSSYQRGLKIDPNHPILHLNLAKSYEHLDELEKAGQEYENALRYKPGWLDAIDGYADLLLKKNKTQVASEIVTQALKINPQNSNMHTKMGNVYSKQSRFDMAEMEYNSALEIQSDNCEALSGLAGAYENQGKHVEAIHTMNSLENLRPDDDTARQFAHVLLSANKMTLAAQKIKKVWDNNPDDVQSLNLLAQYYICKGDEAKAFGCYKKINEINPHYKEHYKESADRYAQKGDYEKALKSAQTYLKSYPQDPRALFSTARNLEKMERTEEAMEIYQNLSEQDQANVAYQKGLERSQIKLGIYQGSPEDTSLVSENEDASDSAAIDYDNFDIDENIGIDDLGAEGNESNDSTFDIAADLEEDMMQDEDIQQEEDEPVGDYSDENSFGALTEDDTDENNVFNRIDDDIMADQSLGDEEAELDDMMDRDDMDDAEDFFSNNPFGSSGVASTGSSMEEAFDPFSDAFETEDLLDDRGSKDPTYSVSDGLEDFDSELTAPSSQRNSVPHNADMGASGFNDFGAEDLSEPSYEGGYGSGSGEGSGGNGIGGGTAGNGNGYSSGIGKEFGDSGAADLSEPSFDDSGAADLSEPSFDDSGAADLSEPSFDDSGAADLSEPSFDDSGAAVLDEPAFDDSGAADLSEPSFDDSGAADLNEPSVPDYGVDGLTGSSLDDDAFDEIFSNTSKKSDAAEQEEEKPHVFEEEVSPEEMEESLNELSKEDTDFYDEASDDEDGVVSVDDIIGENEFDSESNLESQEPDVLSSPEVSMEPDNEEQTLRPDDFIDFKDNQEDQRIPEDELEEGSTYFEEEPSEFLKQSFKDLEKAIAAEDDFGDADCSMNLNPEGFSEADEDDDFETPVIEDYNEIPDQIDEPFVSEEEVDPELRECHFDDISERMDEQLGTPQRTDVTEEPDATVYPEEPALAEDFEAPEVLPCAVSSEYDGMENNGESVTEITEEIINANKEMLTEEEKSAAEMFMELRTLCDYLPDDKKDEFLSSKVKLQLEYLISRLTGKPGLLETAKALRTKWNLEKASQEEIAGDEKVRTKDLFVYMKTLVQALPDPAMAESLGSRLDDAISSLEK